MSETERPENELGARLYKARPVPARGYASKLRHRLLAEDTEARRPNRLWLLVCAYLISSALLLVLALLGALGSGPFGS